MIRVAGARRAATATIALVVALASAACGGGDKQEAKSPQAPGPQAPGAAPTDTQGQVGTMEGSSTSGLQGNAKAAYDRGFQAWLTGDLPAAKKHFQEASEAAPKAPAPFYALGIVLERLGDTSGAQQSYRQAFTVAADHDLAMCALAMSLATSGHAGEADTFLADRRAKRPNNPRLTACNADVKSIARDHGSAQQLAQDALRMDPDFKDAMVSIARDNYRARKLEFAKYALQAILEGFGDASPARDKENPEAHLLRGLIYREGGARAVALKDFEEAVRKRPDMVEALLNLGAMRLEAGNAQEALPVLESAVRFGPRSALAHLNLGDCYRLLGRPVEAKREFDQALAIDSSLAAAHYDLGLLYLFAPNIPGASAEQQVATAIKELQTYKNMRGPKPAAGVNDDVDELLNRANAKQAELRNAVQTQPGAAAPQGGAAAPQGGGKAPAQPPPKPPAKK